MTALTSRLPRSASKDARPSTLPTRRRSAGVVVLGAIVIVLGGLLGLLASTSGDTASVLAVRDQVAPGQTIERDNLISKNVSGVDGTVAVDDVDQVVGATATLGLAEGQVVTRSGISADPIPAAGETVVGVALTPAQVPADGLAAGDVVRVIAVPAADDTSAAAAATSIAPRGRVVSVGRSDAGEASTLVTLIVPDDAANQVATASATGRAAVIKINTAAGEAPAEGEAGD